MELEFPYWARMHIGESVGDRGVDEVPNLDRFITTSSGQMRSRRMEIDSGYPVLVTLTGHDVFMIFEVPDLPSAIVSGRGNDLLFSMQCHSTDTSGMSVNFLLAGHSIVEILKGLGQIWIWSSILGPWCVLALNLHLFLAISSAHSLLFHARVDLLLNFVLMLLDLLLDIDNFFLELVLLEFEERLLFHGVEMFLLDFFDFLLIVFV